MLAQIVVNLHYLTIIDFKELVMEVGVRFHSSMAIPTKTTDIDSSFDNLPGEQKKLLMDRSLKLLEDNLQDYSHLQVWLCEENVLYFVLIPRNVPLKIDYLEYGKILPDENGTVVDAIPFSAFGGDTSSSNVYRHWPSTS